MRFLSELVRNLGSRPKDAAAAPVSVTASIDRESNKRSTDNLVIDAVLVIDNAQP
jgi:hypothetical protein